MARSRSFPIVVLAVAVSAIAHAQPADAQQGLPRQDLPRPIVLYRPAMNATHPAAQLPAGSGTQSARGSGSVTPNSQTAPSQPSRNQPGANTGTTVGPRPAMVVTPATSGVTNPVAGFQPELQRQVPASGGASQDRQAQDPNRNTPKTPEQEWADEQSRPTNQMLQNASGAFNMTHSGFSTSQQMAPNTYLGPQFQNWTNQQSVPQMPASFGEMSRMQPGPFGGYVSPNTYVGPAYTTWNHMSHGTVNPGATGSWSFNVWR